MTTTTARPEPTLPACPAWCEYTAPDHGWDGETTDEVSRSHLIEWPVVVATQDQHTGRAGHPDLFICLVQRETISWDSTGLRRGAFRIAVSTDGYPHLTADEARQAAASLNAAADKLDQVEADARPTAGPEHSDVEAVRGLLEMMNRTGFASDDQRARYLLSSNWLRDRGAAAAERLG